MFTRYRVQLLITLLLLISVWSGANAGVQSGAATEVLLEPARVARFAEKLERILADSGARVAIVARVGRPESELPDGVRYTHVAFAVYSTIHMQNGTTQSGYVMYNLYQEAGRPEISKLVQDYPYDFFAPVSRLTAGIIVPVPELQKRLLHTITSDTYNAVHNPNYSVIANPYNNTTQNCTEFALNVLHAAIYQRTDMDYLKSVTRDHFAAMPIDINPLKLILASAFLGSISIIDHPGPVETVTFGTIERYLGKHGMVKRVFHLDEAF